MLQSDTICQWNGTEEHSMHQSTSSARDSVLWSGFGSHAAINDLHVTSLLWTYATRSSVEIGEKGRVSYMVVNTNENKGS